jgi:hypothetical protein
MNRNNPIVNAVRSQLNNQPYTGIKREIYNTEEVRLEGLETRTQLEY